MKLALHTIKINSFGMKNGEVVQLYFFPPQNFYSEQVLKSISHGTISLSQS
jgi:hypothetical protein